MERQTRVLVAGGGSAGVGAAWRAALCGADVLLVEAGDMLGGASTLGGVNVWEPGIASMGLNRLLFDTLRRRSLSVGVGRSLYPYSPQTNAGMGGLIPNLPYEHSLRRAGLGWNVMARVHFEPVAMHEAMLGALQAAGARVVLGAMVEAVDMDGARVTGVRLRDVRTQDAWRVAVDRVIDCTAEATVARLAGCETLLGEDPASRFREPSAPEIAQERLNGVSLIFRVTPAPEPVNDEAPAWALDTGAPAWLKDNFPASAITAFPNGDLLLNPLPLMQGNEYRTMPPQERLRECQARVYLYWDRMKRECGHRNYRLHSIAPRVGVREGYRVVAQTMLTEQTVRAGYARQPRPEECVALADHPLDTHGERIARLKALEPVDQPYGVPLGCLVTEKYENLLVAGRCAGFSHLAAASCRLNRTMMDLGEAAGAAATEQADMRQASAARVRDILGFDQYLEWVDRAYWHIGEEVSAWPCKP